VPSSAEQPQPTVLVVDDDQAVRASLRRALGLHGFDVALAGDGLAALDAIRRRRPDVLVLDIGMPGVDGLGVLRRLRQDGDDLPILLLTARDAVYDRVRGLTTGADDYLVKPFALEELVARLTSLLRRASASRDAAPADEVALRFADVRLDPVTATARRDGVDLGLTRTEFDLLTVFLEEPNRVLSRSTLHDRVWGAGSEVTDNAIEVYVGYLRRKLEVGGRPRLLHTVRGFGYVLRAAAS
jgi:two-component system, OmpR family, response regulator MprA